MQAQTAYAPTDITVILLDIEQRLRAVLDATGAPAFGTVELYDMSALVVLETVDHENKLEGLRFTIKRSFKITLILANRFYTTRRAAMMGEGATPGLLTLGELAVKEISGKSADYYIAPETGEMFALGSSEANHPDRLAFRQPFTILPAGLLVDQMDKGTARRPR
jgi:hypothetical protein